MGRLINADVLENMKFSCGLNVDGILYVPFREVINNIKNQPTAYDVEKVEQELKEWTFNADVNIGDGTIMNHDLILSAIAIYIVREGGIDG